MEKKDYKNYFLGLISAEDTETIELQIIADEKLEGELLQAENVLIEDFLAGNLTDKEIKAFNLNFLITEERRKRVEFVQAMQSYAQNSATKSAVIKEIKPSFFSQLKFFFSPRKFAFTFGGIAVFLSIGLIGYLGWNNYSHQSEISVLLNKSFKNERPTEARITEFDYAPKIEGTRGNGDKTQDLNLVSAKSRATEAVLKDESAENLHELGRVYLAEKNFDEAIKQFEKAIKKNPDVAKLHNDLGVALFEKAKLKEDGKLENLAKAGEEFAKAIKLDKSSLEAYFNQALCIQNLNLPNQAREAWQNYLNLDSTSKWADEARKNLATLETQKPISKTKEEILRDFLAAKEAHDDEKAWQVLSRNREMITGKLIPQQLTFLFVDSKSNGEETQAAKALDALIYAGRLEEEKAGDLFWKDVAKYYANVSDNKISILKTAQYALTEANSLIAKNKFAIALDKFRFASRIFATNGNLFEAQITNNYVAYCLVYADEKSQEIEKAKIKIVTEIIEFSQKNNYKWLLSLALLRAASFQNDLIQYSIAIRYAEKSLVLSKECNDSFGEQRALGLLAGLYSTLGQNKKAIAYTQQIFTTMNDADNSLRQKWRNYFSAADLFVSVRSYHLGKMMAKEGISVSEQIGEAGIISISQNQTGMILAKTNETSSALDFLNRGLQNAQTLEDNRVRKNLVAYSFLRLADLEQEVGNYEKAAQLYDESFKTNDSPFFEFEIQKGRLRSFLAVRNDTELERQIPITIETAEQNRAKILEEQQSNSFFNSENDVFETAIEWEFERGNFEKSYNYAEGANARSLLDFLEKSQSSTDSESKEPFNLSVKTKPLTLTEIQQQISENVQLLQYTILDKKLLIWLVSKNQFIVRQVPISAEKLQGLIEKYVVLIKDEKQGLSAEHIQLSQDIYSVLIQPIRDSLDVNKQICIIPGKVLFFVPFSALISLQGKLFLEEFVTIYAPSANIFVHCTKNAAKKSNDTSEAILSVGNPAFDSDVFTDLANLQYAEKEAKNIATFYDSSKSKVLLGKTATKHAFQESIGNVQIIHFAGHYLVNPNLPLDSGLLFAKNEEAFKNSVLTNSELLNENLKRLKLVVLSSCETGVESYLNGEGMIGLSRTFLAIDTPLVVASQWKVDSESTEMLMEKFHRFRREQKLSTVVALRKAQLEMINDNKFKTPYYWAAFATFGGYSNF